MVKKYYCKVFNMLMQLSFHLEIKEMEYSNGEIELFTESVVSYHWSVNGVPQPQATGNVLSLDKELVEDDQNDGKIEVEVTVQSQCGATVTRTFVIVRDSVEASPTPTSCKSESKQ